MALVKKKNSYCGTFLLALSSFKLGFFCFSWEDESTAIEKYVTVKFFRTLLPGMLITV